MLLIFLTASFLVFATPIEVVSKIRRKKKIPTP
jgi:hypothetical protein